MNAWEVIRDPLMLPVVVMRGAGGTPRSIRTTSLTFPGMISFLPLYSSIVPVTSIRSPT